MVGKHEISVYVNCAAWYNGKKKIHILLLMEDVKMIMSICFLVASEYRGQGIANKFLNRVCEDTKIEGYK